MLTLTMIALAAPAFRTPEWQAFSRWRGFYERRVSGMEPVEARYDPAAVRHGIRYVRVRYGVRHTDFGRPNQLAVYWIQIDCRGRRSHVVSEGDLRRQRPLAMGFEPFQPWSVAGHLAARICPRTPIR